MRACRKKLVMFLAKLRTPFSDNTNYEITSKWKVLMKKTNNPSTFHPQQCPYVYKQNRRKCNFFHLFLCLRFLLYTLFLRVYRIPWWYVLLLLSAEIPVFISWKFWMEWYRKVLSFKPKSSSYQQEMVPNKLWIFSAKNVSNKLIFTNKVNNL